MDPKYIGIIWTGSGLLDVRNPDPKLIKLREIARGLSCNNKFGGHSLAKLPPYNVAWHCLFCEAVADRLDYPLEVRLQALFHDAAEAYLGDLITPLKELFPLFSIIERNLLDAIFQKFRVPADLDPRVKEIDRWALDVERLHIMPPDIWDPAPDIPPEIAKIGDTWFDWIHKQSKQREFASSFFYARACALLDAYWSQLDEG